MNERDKLLKNIQEEDFAVYETVLYLDGHPCDKDALEFYKVHRDKLDCLKKEFIQKYGPLTIYDNLNCNTWDWIKSPWPWEREAN